MVMRPNVLVVFKSDDPPRPHLLLQEYLLRNPIQRYMYLRPNWMWGRYMVACAVSGAVGAEIECVKCVSAVRTVEAATGCCTQSAVGRCRHDPAVASGSHLHYPMLLLDVYAAEGDRTMLSHWVLAA